MSDADTSSELESLRREVDRLREVVATEDSNRTAQAYADFLLRVGTELLSASVDHDETLRRIASLAVPTIADWCVIQVSDDEEPGSLSVVVSHVDPHKVGLAKRLEALYPPDPQAPNGPYQVIRTGRPELYETVTDELLVQFASDAQHLALLRALKLHSVIIVPMKARAEIIGAITLVYTESGRAYSINELGVAERLAQKAALAVENARILRASQRARELVERGAERMDSLRSIMGALGTTLSTSSVAEVVIEQGVAALQAVRGAIWLVDRSGQTAVMIRSKGYPPELEAQLSRMPVSTDAPAAEALRTGEPIFLASSAEYALRYPSVVERFEGIVGLSTSAVACLPILIDGRSSGVIALAFDGPRAVDDTDRRFLLLLAEHCARALERAANMDAERRARSEIALLYELVDGVSRARTLDEVYEPALRVVERAFDVHRCAILLFDPDGVLRFKAWRGLSDAYRAAAEGHSPWVLSTRSPQPVIVADTHEEPSLAHFRAILDAEEIRSLAYVPLRHGGQLIGKFMIYRPDVGSFSDDEMRLAQTIAAQVAQAVARQMADAETLRLYNEAETANRTKDEFLAVVSHELRTPLSAIVGWASMLRGERRFDPDAVAKGVEVIERNAHAQTKIIEDILDVSRIITGKLVIDARPVSLVAIVGEALDSVRAAAAAKDISLVFVPSEDPHAVLGDSLRLRQVVWNLLSNAIKFTGPGGRVEARLSRGLNTVELSVRDTGVGIAPELLPRVFDRFRQADASTSRRHGGLGLGLAIVRHLAELHGGHVDAKSDGLGRGSTFTVTVPIRAAFVEGETRTGEAIQVAPTTTAPAGDLADLHGVRVLVTDDESDARDMLREILVGYGADVELAGSAGEALDRLAQFHPDILVCDIGMPGEDGYSLIRRVRDRGGELGATPAIALTAYARPEDTRRALSAGFQLHLSKPIDSNVLVASVARLASSLHAPH